MKRGWYWPLLIVVLLFVGGIGPNLILLAFATGDPSFSVEPDYYEKSLRWDERLAQDRRNSELGWTLAIATRPGPPPEGGIELTARLADRSGAPLEGATVTLEAFHNARASDVLALALEDVGEGSYGARLLARRPGLWEFRFVVRRDGEVFTRTLVEDVWPGI
jgi:nitrogen fixation protein FixH